jgi:pyrroloquinoline quinone (PQQ) biosynthesis protein C
MSPDEIVYHYPSITLADVHAALAYYYDHLEEIRQHIRESEALANQLATKTPSLLQRKLKERASSTIRPCQTVPPPIASRSHCPP